MKTIPLTIGPIHFVGIGGIGMSGIAEILRNLGYQVQGSDVADNANVRRLRGLGIAVTIGHAAENLGNAGVVVVSSAVKTDNPEVVAARARLRPGGAPRRDAGRADAPQMGDRGRRHSRQDDHHLDDRRACSTRPGSIPPSSTAASSTPMAPTRGWAPATGWWSRPTRSDGTFVKLPATIAVVTNIDPEHMEF